MAKASEPTTVPADAEVSYDAFISYSMAADEVLAPRLRVALQRFAVPWYRRRAIRVFCAPSDMAANPRLWGTLQNSLVASRYLILLASPEAAASDWVGRELEWWRENRPPETLLIAVTGGVLRWGQADGDFDWDQTTAIPRALADHFDDEPYWVDLREIPRPGEGVRDLGHDARFQDAVATLGATIRGQPKSDLVGEDIRQRRRALRLAWSAAIVLLVLALTATTLGAVAKVQQGRATHQAAVAVSRYLASQSEAQARGNPQLSMLLSLASWKTEPTDEARAAVLAQAGRWRYVRRFLSDPAGGQINDMALSLDGTVLATAMDDGRVVLWDPVHHTRRRTLTTGIEHPRAVGITADGKRLVVGGAHAALYVWDVSGGARVMTLSVGTYRANIYSLAIAGTDVVAAGDDTGRVVVWDLKSRRPGTLLKAHHGVVTGLAFSPGGLPVATASPDGTVKLWQAGAAVQTTPARTFTTTDAGSQPVALAFSPDGGLLAASSYRTEGGVIVWNTSTGKVVHRMSGHYAPVRAMTFVGRNGDLLATGGADERVLLWDVRSERVIRRLEAHTGPVSSMAVGKDGRTLYSAGEDGNVIEWDLLGDAVSSHADSARAITIRSDGAKALTGGGDGTVDIVSLTGSGGAKEVPIPSKAPVTGLATSRDGSRVAVATRADVWLTGPTGVGGRLPVPPVPAAAVAFSPDGRTLAAAGGSRGLVLWDTAGRKPIMLGDGVNDYDSVAFSPDGQLLAAGSTDVGVWLWDARTHRRIGELTGHSETSSGLAFSPDGHLLASAGLEGRIILWDVGRRSVERVLTGHSIAASRVAFTPDGRTLLSGDLNGDVIRWDVATGRQRALLPAQNDQVLDIAVPPSGDRLFVAYGSGVVLEWTIDVYTAFDRLCAIVGRGLTTGEDRQYLIPASARSPCR